MYMQWLVLFLRLLIIKFVSDVQKSRHVETNSSYLILHIIRYVSISSGGSRIFFMVDEILLIIIVLKYLILCTILRKQN